MKILVADRISPTGVAYLKQQPGFEVIEAYGSKPEQVLELVKDVDAIAVRSETQITREVIAAAPKLKISIVLRSSLYTSTPPVAITIGGRVTSFGLRR